MLHLDHAYQKTITTMHKILILLCQCIICYSMTSGSLWNDYRDKINYD